MMDMDFNRVYSEHKYSCTANISQLSTLLMRMVLPEPLEQVETFETVCRKCCWIYDLLYLVKSVKCTFLENGIHTHMYRLPLQPVQETQNVFAGSCI